MILHIQELDFNNDIWTDKRYSDINIDVLGYTPYLSVEIGDYSSAFLFEPTIEKIGKRLMIVQGYSRDIKLESMINDGRWLYVQQRWIIIFDRS